METIVYSPKDAIIAFKNSGLEYLVITISGLKI